MLEECLTRRLREKYNKHLVPDEAKESRKTNYPNLSEGEHLFLNIVHLLFIQELNRQRSKYFKDRRR